MFASQVFFLAPKHLPPPFKHAKFRRPPKTGPRKAAPAGPRPKAGRAQKAAPKAQRRAPRFFEAAEEQKTSIKSIDCNPLSPLPVPFFACIPPLLAAPQK